MFSIKRLYELQELDWNVSAHEKSLAEVRATLADDSALLSARERIERAEAQLEIQSSARQRVESALQRLNDRLQVAEKRLYGGAVTNPRELAAAEEERNAILGQRTTEEDRLLELMVEIEDLQSARDEAQEQLSRLEVQRATEHPKLLKEEERLVGELGTLRQTRDRLTPEIPPSVLSVYESLRKSRNGQAMAKVERGMCQGCRLALPEMVRQRARSSRDIIQCSSCQRILYVA